MLEAGAARSRGTLPNKVSRKNPERAKNAAFSCVCIAPFNSDRQKLVDLARMADSDVTEF
jgi:hypothetical protein